MWLSLGPFLCIVNAISSFSRDDFEMLFSKMARLKLWLVCHFHCTVRRAARGLAKKLLVYIWKSRKLLNRRYPWVFVSITICLDQ